MVKLSKAVLPLILAFFWGSVLSAQIGLSSSYKWMQAPNWGDYYQNELGNNPYPLAGWDFGIDYWFRLKSKRVEFLPEASFIKQDYFFGDGWSKYRFYNLALNVNLYPFDFDGDCNCPTWSKDGSFFSKGFFIQLSPGISWLKNEFKNEPLILINDERVAFFIRAGIGLDIGVTDFLTVSPLARFSFAPGVDWPSPVESIRSSIFQTEIGVRLGFRLEELGK